MLRLSRSQGEIVARLAGSKGMMTRRNLCALTGLSWAAISKTVSQLESKGLLKYGETISNKKRGRNPEIVSFGTKYLLAGLSVEAGSISFSLMNFLFEPVSEFEIPLAPSDDPISAICVKLRELLSCYKGQIVSVGISFPGIISPQKNVAIKSSYFPDCAGRNIQQEIKLSAGLDIPILVERNAVCALTYLNLSKDLSEDSLLLSATQGLSAAMMVDGQILHGGSGNIGEFGHLKSPEAEQSAIPCSCGSRGCIETVCGGKAWQAHWDLLNPSSHGLPQSFAEAIGLGSPPAVDLLTKGIRCLFPALSYVIRLFRPQRLIFVIALPPDAVSIIRRQLLEIFLADDISESPELEFVFRSDFATPRGAALLGLLNISGNPFYRDRNT